MSVVLAAAEINALAAIARVAPDCAPQPHAALRRPTEADGGRIAPLDSLSIVRRAIVDDDARLVFATASHGPVEDYMRGGEYPFLPGFATVAEIAASPLTRNPP